MYICMPHLDIFLRVFFTSVSASPLPGEEEEDRPRKVVPGLECADWG
jgi:hypothetical protein